jgi:hypothetical protein
MLGSPRRTDPLARNAALAIGASRVGLGVATLFATPLALRALGFGEGDARMRALAKLAGGRDFALGALTLIARDDPERLRTLLLAGAALDAADAVSLGLGAADPETRAAAIGGLASGGAAALAGLWAHRRLSG